MMDKDEAGIFSQFGQAEQMMGQDAYQASVKHQEAHANMLGAEKERIEAVAAAIKSVAVIFTLGGLLTLMPVIVYLWRWALS